MVCIIRMDAGTPETHPQPEAWKIANTLDELMANLNDDALLISQIQKISDNDKGLHHICPHNMELQCFLLIT